LIVYALIILAIIEFNFFVKFQAALLWNVFLLESC